MAYYCSILVGLVQSVTFIKNITQMNIWMYLYQKFTRMHMRKYLYQNFDTDECRNEYSNKFKYSYSFHTHVQISEYIHTNKFDTNEWLNIFLSKKLIRTNFLINICDKYIPIFKYSNIFVKLWFSTISLCHIIVSYYCVILLWHIIMAYWWVSRRRADGVRPGPRLFHHLFPLLPLFPRNWRRDSKLWIPED